MAFTLGGVTVKAPSSFSVDWDIVYSGESGTNENGGEVCRILARKRTLSYGWAPLTTAESAAIFGALASGNTFAAYYPDPESGWTTKTCKIVSLGAPLFSGTDQLWNGASLSLREV